MFFFDHYFAYILLGSRLEKTKFSRKITSMIYTSNCILSKVVNETAVAAISTCHLSPAGVFSFVSLFFLAPVAPKRAPAWAQAPVRSRVATSGHPRRYLSPDSSPSLARRSSPGDAGGWCACVRWRRLFTAPVVSLWRALVRE